MSVPPATTINKATSFPSSLIHSLLDMTYFLKRQLVVQGSHRISLLVFLQPLAIEAADLLCATIAQWGMEPDFIVEVRVLLKIS